MHSLMIWLVITSQKCNHCFHLLVLIITAIGSACRKMSLLCHTIAHPFSDKFSAKSLRPHKFFHAVVGLCCCCCCLKKKKMPRACQKPPRTRRIAVVSDCRAAQTRLLLLHAPKAEKQEMWFEDIQKHQQQQCYRLEAINSHKERWWRLLLLLKVAHQSQLPQRDNLQFWIAIRLQLMD